MVLIRVRLAEVDTSDPDGCWEWPGARARGGYGIVGGSRWKKIPPFRVNRVVLADALGRPLAPGERALHRCDNPPCFNPRHLYAGTQRRNIQDARERGRIAAGERNANARLSENDVRRIRLDDRPNAVVASEFGVMAEQIRRIRKKERWRHVL